MTVCGRVCTKYIVIAKAIISDIQYICNKMPVCIYFIV